MNPPAGSPLPINLSLWTARGFVALVALWAAAAVPAAAPAPLAATGIVGALCGGRWWRGKPWKWIPDVFLVCLPYWVALSFRLGAAPAPGWVLGCAVTALGVVMAFPTRRVRGAAPSVAPAAHLPHPGGRLRGAASPALFDLPPAERTYVWALVLRRQARGLYQALPVAVVSLVLLGFFLMYADRGFDRAALVRYLGHLGLFFAGVPLALTAVYGAISPD